MTHCFLCSWWLGAPPSIEQFGPTAAIEAGSVWKVYQRVILAGGSELVVPILVVAPYVKGMLACVVDCSQICRARSTSRKTGCEGKLRPAEKEYDEDVLIRAFCSSIGYKERSCTARSERGQCLDGPYEQSDCINSGKDDPESEDESVDNDTGSEEQLDEEQGSEDNHARVTDRDHDRRLGEEAEVVETKPGLRLYSDTSSWSISNSDFTTRMPAKSTERLQISSRGTQSESVEQILRRLTETPIGAVSTELGPPESLRFGEGAESVDLINKGGGRRKEPQLAERGSKSHEFFGERLDVVGSRRDERSGVQLGPSSSWGDDLRGSQEQLSFQGEDTVECITNVGEEDDFGFDVEEFQTSHHGQKHNEPIPETERLSEFHTRGESSQGGQDRQSSPSPTFDSPQTQNETTLKARTGSRLRSSVKESDGSHLPVDTTTGGRKFPEAGAGQAGKGQEKDLRGEGHLRKSEASIVSDERRVRARLEGPATSGRGEETEEASAKIVRPSRPSGGKDRHSKVNTAKGPRDRRVRLSVPTAVQFYDVQDRLGYDQPSKAVEWLIKKAKSAIDELGRLPARGNDGPSTLSDITHSSPYSAALGGPVSGSSSCPPAGSFSNSPFGDHIGNHISYFIDSSPQQGVSFGNHPVHTTDITGGVGLNQGHLVTGQGQIAGLSFPLGQMDLSRGNPGCIEGGKPGEFSGRVESRFKARERARERVKEKGTGRDCGKVTGSVSSPPSLQSPNLHQNPIHTSFPAQNALQSSARSLSLQNPHPSALQSSLSSVFDTTLCGIMENSQQGTLQNLIMQNPSLQSPLADQVQSSLQHPFQAPLQNTLQLASQSMTSLQNPGIRQQSHLQRSSLEGGTQRALHLGSGFTPVPCDSSSFSGAASLSSSDFMSISSIPISHSLSMSELSSFGLTSPSSMGPHFPTGSSGVQIPPGFSPGPPASAFQPRDTKESQLHLQSLSRPQCQLILPSYSTGHGLASPGGSTSSKASTSLYYPPTSLRMGSLQCISPSHLESSSFSSIRNVRYDYQRLQMMSPGRASGSFQTSSSQLQMPARLQPLEDFDEELKSSPPSSPHVHP